MYFFYKGVDPSLLSSRSWTSLVSSLKQSGCTLMGIDENLIDLIWSNQPAAPSGKVIPLDIEYSGKSVGRKVEEIREKMVEVGCSITVVTALDEIAWLFNLRYDFEHSFALKINCTNINI